ncbi:hypothetical protein CHUAL_013787 [Chamberlinius hualienensis]
MKTVVKLSLIMVLLHVVGIMSEENPLENPALEYPSAESRPPPTHSYQPIYEPYEERDYKFGYAIKDDYTYNQHSRQEHKYGNTVTGRYTVLEPNGYLRIVHYVADDKGFRAEVQRQQPHNEEYNHNPKIKAPLHPGPVPIYDRQHQLPSSRVQTHVPQKISPEPSISFIPPPPLPMSQPLPAQEEISHIRSSGRRKMKRPTMKLHRLHMQMFPTSPLPPHGPNMKLKKRRPTGKRNKPIHSGFIYTKMLRPPPDHRRPIPRPNYQHTGPLPQPFIPEFKKMA